LDREDTLCMVVRDLDLWLGDNNVMLEVCLKGDEIECLVVLGAKRGGQVLHIELLINKQQQIAAGVSLLSYFASIYVCE